MLEKNKHHYIFLKFVNFGYKCLKNITNSKTLLREHDLNDIFCFAIAITKNVRIIFTLHTCFFIFNLYIYLFLLFFFSTTYHTLKYVKKILKIEVYIP